MKKTVHKCPRVQIKILKLKISEPTMRLLSACAGFQNQTPENYTLEALISVLECDCKNIGAAFCKERKAL